MIMWGVIGVSLKWDLLQICGNNRSPACICFTEKVKRKTEENVQVYAERLLSLVEEAFTGQNGGVAAIERQLVFFFWMNRHMIT